MIFVELNETTGEAKTVFNGSLGLVYAELALVIRTIADNEELDYTVDDIFDEIRECMVQG